MAIRTIPSSIAQQAARQQLMGPTVNPLDSLMQGFQTGQVIQNLPQTIQGQQEALALQQLERQLATQVAQQRLRDLQDPQGAVLRQLQQQLTLKTVDPTSGVVVSPIMAGDTIEGGGVLTGTEAIGLPGALTPAQEAALIAGGAQPVVAPGAAIVPLTVGGRPTGFAQDIERAASSTEALSRAKGTTALERQLLANAQTEANRLSRERVAADANASRERQATIRSGGKGASGLSATRISIIAGKAGEAGFTQEDIDQKYTENGVVDWNRLNIDANREVQNDVKEAARIKSSQLPASLREKASGFIAAHSDLGELTTALKDLKIQGKEPNSWERAVGVALESPPDSVFSALYQTVLGQGLTAEAREINALKARVRSAVTRANAGLSQTEREIANVTQYSPATNDDIEQTLRKAAGLEGYLRGQVKAITVDPNEWLRSFERGAPSTTSSPVATPGINPQAPAPVSSGRKIGRFTITQD